MTHPQQPLEGWYPNPDGSDSLRWWDGRQWTGQHRPLGSALNAAARPYVGNNSALRAWGGLARNTRVAVIAGAVVAAVAAAIGVIGNFGGSAHRRVSGTMDDWLAAVCRTDYPMFTDAPVFGSLGGTRCVAKPQKNSPLNIIFADRFPTIDAVHDFMTTTHNSYYAVGTDKAGTVTALFIQNKERVVLEPLTRFGFVIYDPPASR